MEIVSWSLTVVVVVGIVVNIVVNVRLGHHSDLLKVLVVDEPDLLAEPRCGEISAGQEDRTAGRECLEAGIGQW